MPRNRPVRATKFERERLKPKMSAKSGPAFKSPGAKVLQGRGCTARIGLSARSGRLSMQRTVVKLTYHPVGGIQGLVKYAAHEGPDEDGNDQEHVVGFSETADAVDGHAVAAAWVSANDPRYFHMIVSPENGGRIADMKPVIRGGMAQLQKDWGTRVEWIGYQHDRDQDGAGRHVHVIMRGVDRDGHELLIAPSYVREGLIYRWSEQVTKEIGPRSEREIRTGLEQSARLREHKAEKDRLVEVAVDAGIMTRKEANTVNRQYAKSGQDGKDQIVQQVRNAIDRQRSQEPEITR